MTYRAPWVVVLTLILIACGEDAAPTVPIIPMGTGGVPAPGVTGGVPAGVTGGVMTPPVAGTMTPVTGGDVTAPPVAGTMTPVTGGDMTTPPVAGTMTPVTGGEMAPVTGGDMAAGTGGEMGAPIDASTPEGCIQKAMMQDRYGDPECVDCGCTKCTSLITSCEEAADADFASKCSAVVRCGQENNCRGAGCLCGELADGAPDVASCILSPMGPCASQIMAAAGQTDLLMINEVLNSGDMSNPLVVASAVGDCTKGSIDALDGTVTTGMCEAECN